MPLIGFRYPNGDTISLEDVANNKVDLGRMGVTLPTLLEMSKQRPSDRMPSTTELLSGTCQAYLQRTTDYFESPDSQAFSIAGTRHHDLLEKSALDSSSQMTEIELEYDGITGTADLYDVERKMLVDYKMSGSYKIAKALGVQVRHSFHPTEVYKTSGRHGKKGTPRRVKEFYIDKDKELLYILSDTIISDNNNIEIECQLINISEILNLGLEKSLFLNHLPILKNKNKKDYCNYKKEINDIHDYNSSYSESL